MKIRDFLLRRKNNLKWKQWLTQKHAAEMRGDSFKRKCSSSEQMKDKNAAKITISKDPNDFIRSELKLSHLCYLIFRDREIRDPF